MHYYNYVSLKREGAQLITCYLETDERLDSLDQIGRD
jgi:hypothetical protein